MACTVKTKFQYSGPSVSSGRSKLFGHLLAIITLVVIPANSHGQSVRSVVTDLSVIVDGGVRKKSVFPETSLGRLKMPKGPVHSRLHIIPEKPVSKIQPHKPRKKTIITSRNKQIKETEKAPLQTVITPGPKPKVQVTQVPTQKPKALAKTEKQPRHSSPASRKETSLPACLPGAWNPC